MNFPCHHHKSDRIKGHLGNPPLFWGHMPLYLLYPPLRVSCHDRTSVISVFHWSNGVSEVPCDEVSDTGRFWPLANTSHVTLSSLFTPHIHSYCVSSRSFLFPLIFDTELTLHLSPIQLRHYSCHSSHRKMLGVLLLTCAIACLLWFLATPFRTGLWSISGPWWRRYTGEIEVFIRCFKNLTFH